MKIYLVGGAIRDQLLGLPVTERDYVVVGASPEEMIAQGFKPVGKDFPVFLHPETHEEYALARTERKVGKGYKGFTFYCGEDVNLSQDLLRRDLTINAIAQDDDGTLIDPYGGQVDLTSGWLKHVSPAFAEDPVRILRLARFASKLPSFKVYPDTLQLMQDMVAQGEVDALVPERVWQEFAKALQHKDPLRFIIILQDCGALATLWPSLAHNEVAHALLHKAAELSTDPIIRFATLMCTLPAKELQQICTAYKIPSAYAEPALLASKYLSSMISLDMHNADAIWQILKSLDALRRPLRLETFLTIYTIMKHDDPEARKRAALITTCRDAVSDINTKPLQQQGLEGQAFAEALRALQLACITDTIEQ